MLHGEVRIISRESVVEHPADLLDVVRLRGVPDLHANAESVVVFPLREGAIIVTNRVVALRNFDDHSTVDDGCARVQVRVSIVESIGIIGESDPLF